MMMNFNTWSGLAYSHQFNILFYFILLTALILFVAWMVKFAKKDTLRNWIIGLLIIGLLGWLIFSPMSGFGRWGNRSFNSFGYGPTMMTSGMLDCMQDEECHEKMEEFMEKMMSIEDRQ